MLKVELGKNKILESLEKALRASCENVSLVEALSIGDVIRIYKWFDEGEAPAYMDQDLVDKLEGELGIVMNPSTFNWKSLFR